MHGARRRADGLARHVRHERGPERPAAAVRRRSRRRAVVVAVPDGRRVGGRVRRSAEPVVRVAAHAAAGAARRARAVPRQAVVDAVRLEEGETAGARVPAVLGALGARGRRAARRGPRPVGRAGRRAGRLRPPARGRRVADRRRRVRAARAGRDRRRPAGRPAVHGGVVRAAAVVRVAVPDDVLPRRARVLAGRPRLRPAQHAGERADHAGRGPAGRAGRGPAARGHGAAEHVRVGTSARHAPAARRQRSRVPAPRVPRPAGRAAAGRARRAAAVPVRRPRRPRLPAVVHARQAARRALLAGPVAAGPAARAARHFPVGPVCRFPGVPVRPAARGRRRAVRGCRLRPGGARGLHPRVRLVPHIHSEPVARPHTRPAHVHPGRVLHVPVRPPGPAERHAKTRPVERGTQRPIARRHSACRVRRSTVRVRPFRRRLRLVPVLELARLERQRLRRWQKRRSG